MSLICSEIAVFGLFYRFVSLKFLFRFDSMVITSPDLSSSSMSVPAIDDGFGPYYLHHSDSLGLLLVSQPLMGENYASWSRAMLIALSVKNKLDFINGTISRPPGDDLLLLNAWIQNNNVVISWLLNSVSKDISVSAIFSESAREIWLDL